VYQRRPIFSNIVFDLTRNPSGPKNVVFIVEHTGKILKEAHIFVCRVRIFKRLWSTQVSIPRNEFLGSLAGWYNNTIPSWFLAPIDSLKIPAQGKYLKKPIFLYAEPVLLNVYGAPGFDSKE
jgi:hypothetical protein